jgi:hypothetical protein
MTKEPKLENLAPLHQLPDEPNFDDELTILRARPVVPLEHIRQMPKHKSNWFLLGSFALAMVLGAASGLISAYFKLREVSEARVIQFGVSTSDSLSSMVADKPLPPTVFAEPLTKTSLASLLSRRFSYKVQQPRLVTLKRVVSGPRRVTRNTKHSFPLPQLSEDEELRRIRQTLLIDDLQKRRVRRTERREQRRT